MEHSIGVIASWVVVLNLLGAIALVIHYFAFGGNEDVR